MRYGPERHRRRSLRLRGYDYSQPGAYFVTICSDNRLPLFGEVVDGLMQLNAYGAIVWEEWFRSAEIRQEIELFPEEFVVMPNHIHGIVWIVESHHVESCDVGANDVAGANKIVGATGRSPLQNPTPQPKRSPLQNPTPLTRARGPHKRSLSSFIAGFKAATTKRINEMRGTKGSPVWQRNYYEHVIRNDESLNRIRQYIATNPLRWAMDRENANRRATDEFDQWLDSVEERGDAHAR